MSGGAKAPSRDIPPSPDIPETEEESAAEYPIKSDVVSGSPGEKLEKMKADLKGKGNK